MLYLLNLGFFFLSCLSLNNKNNFKYFYTVMLKTHSEENCDFFFFLCVFLICSFAIFLIMQNIL